MLGLGNSVGVLKNTHTIWKQKQTCTHCVILWANWKIDQILVINSSSRNSSSLMGQNTGKKRTWKSSSPSSSSLAESGIRWRLPPPPLLLMIIIIRSHTHSQPKQFDSAHKHKLTQNLLSTNCVFAENNRSPSLPTNTVAGNEKWEHTHRHRE